MRGKPFSMFLVTSLAMITLLTPATPAAAVERPLVMLLRSCANAPATPCIERIAATDKTGRRVNAELTGVTQGTTELDGQTPWTLDEYRLPGFKFEGSAEDRVVPRIIFRPLGSETCRVDGSDCRYDLEEVQVVVEPSWLHRTASDDAAFTIRMPHRSTDAVCGSAARPETCSRPLNFNQVVGFEITLQLPDDFRTALVNAQTDSFSLSEGEQPREIAGRKYSSTTIRFNTVLHAQGLFAVLQPDPIGTSSTADFMTDQTNIWVFGTKSREGLNLGRCAGIPRISVIANSIYQSTPTWNAKTQSVDVTVTSFHLLPDGTKNVGFFQATISQAMGKCLWGIDLSTKTRTVLNITDGSQGAQQVALETSKFDGENYILTARNFHFSSPTISFRLESPQTDPGPSQISAPKVRTITCVKGTQTKKIKSTNPKCARGWKLKKP